jgi:uncharacterized protein YdbL (DUF1318 family)
MRKGRPSADDAESTRHAVIQLLRKNPLLSYTDVAKAAQLSKARIGQIAAEEPGLEAYRQQWKDDYVKRLNGKMFMPGEKP